MRAALKKLGGSPDRSIRAAFRSRDRPFRSSRLVGTACALQENADIEFERNRERYQFLRWGQNAFKNFRVVPPDTGIVHQVNLEYLSMWRWSGPLQEAAKMGLSRYYGRNRFAHHDDQRPGLLGWGVGGIEAEAAMLGQPCTMLIPQVVGFKLTGKLAAGTTATDLVLTVTQMLRKKGVVGKFVEFYGAGLATSRSPIARRSPIWRRIRRDLRHLPGRPEDH